MDIYTENILDHYQHPHHNGRLAKPAATISVYNPLCGDTLTLDIQIEKNKITDIAFIGTGCAISQAAMSLLTDYSLGKTTGVLKKIKPKIIYDLLGTTVSPARTKCALLGWDGLQKMITSPTVVRHAKK